MTDGTSSIEYINYLKYNSERLHSWQKFSFATIYPLTRILNIT